MIPASRRSGLSFPSYNVEPFASQAVFNMEPSMNIEYMREFVRLAETLNFTKTARDFYITQPTLSKHLSNLEKELDAPLMVRSTHEVRLTEAGKVASQRFSEILALYESSLRDIDQVKTGMQGRIRLGFIYYGGMSYMREGLASYREEYPHVQVNFVSCQPYQVIEGLLKDDLDVGLVMRTDALPEKDFRFVPVHECLLYAFVGENSPLATRDSLTLEEVSAELCLVFKNDPYYTEALRNAAEARGARPRQSFSCDQIDLFPTALNQRGGVMLGTGHLPHGEDDHVVRIPIEEKPSFPVGLYVRHTNINVALPGFLRQWDQ